MFVLWAVDENRKAYLKVATFRKLHGFFDRPEPGYDDDGWPQTFMSFTLLEVELEVPWTESGPDGCHGLRIAVHDSRDQPIGHYHVSPTFVGARESRMARRRSGYRATSARTRRQAPT